MSEQLTPPWFDDFLGVAYRYFDLRMNVVPLFPTRKKAVNMWHEIVRWWIDPTIKIRFVEEEEQYWFIMGAESQNPSSNVSLFKQLLKSVHYERFKKGHEGEVYLRLGTYSKQYREDVKDDILCDCGHAADEHEEEARDESGNKVTSCLYEDCTCSQFETFQVNLLKKKKTITDIKFLQEYQVKDDPLAWNCLQRNKYAKE